MSDEKQEKTRKHAIGGIGRQYATLGGRKASTADVQASEVLNVQDAERSGVQTPSSLSAEESKRSDVQASSSLNAQEPKRSRWKRRTIYLYPDVDRAVRHHIADTDEEISEVVNAALRQFFRLPAT